MSSSCGWIKRSTAVPAAGGPAGFLSAAPRGGDLAASGALECAASSTLTNRTARLVMRPLFRLSGALSRGAGPTPWRACPRRTGFPYSLRRSPARRSRRRARGRPADPAAPRCGSACGRRGVEGDDAVVAHETGDDVARALEDLLVGQREAVARLQHPDPRGDVLEQQPHGRQIRVRVAGPAQDEPTIDNARFACEGGMATSRRGDSHCRLAASFWSIRHARRPNRGIPTA